MTWYDDRGARADTSTLVRTHSHSDDAKDRRDESQHTPRPRARIGRVPLMIGIVLLALLIGGGAALALTRGGSNGGTGGQPGTSGSGGSTTGRKPGASGSIAVPASFSITGRAHFHFPAFDAAPETQSDAKVAVTIDVTCTSSQCTVVQKAPGAEAVPPLSRTGPGVFAATKHVHQSTECGPLDTTIAYGLRITGTTATYTQNATGDVAKKGSCGALQAPSEYTLRGPVVAND